MCKPASFIITTDRVFWSRFTDSHEEIVSEFKLHADGAKGPNIVRLEITPPGDDMTLPADEWMFKVDQDLLPSWWDAEDGEKRARAALVEWISACVISGDRSEPVTEGRVFIFGTGRAELYDSSRAELHGSSSAVLYGSSRAVLYDSSRAELCNSSSALLYGSSRAVLRGSSRAVLRDRSSAELYDSSSAECKNHSTVIRLSEHAAVTLADNAVMVDRSGDKPACKVAEE